MYHNDFMVWTDRFLKVTKEEGTINRFEGVKDFEQLGATLTKNPKIN